MFHSVRSTLDIKIFHVQIPALLFVLMRNQCLTYSMSFELNFEIPSSHKCKPFYSLPNVGIQLTQICNNSFFATHEINWLIFSVFKLLVSCKNFVFFCWLAKISNKLLESSFKRSLFFFLFSFAACGKNSPTFIF